ncbi:hypothetical protein AMTR_s00063p00172080 [Amborella trichopoda]|uniref:Uncharacterized protein n=1 Tax=Amborella trichopoda TaxID=13333 RepID=U5D203_AMBTC|nr:hypothetical protein AMTR_s00063p00172080 [Amborella trichopoda]
MSGNSRMIDLLGSHSVTPYVYHYTRTLAPIHIQAVRLLGWSEYGTVEHVSRSRNRYTDCLACYSLPGFLHSLFGSLHAYALHLQPSILVAPHPSIQLLKSALA